MTFPSKEYFSITEVASRWHRKVKDVEYCIENGLLNAHIKVCAVKLSPVANNNENNICKFTGCVKVLPEDCHIMFRHYKRTISELLSTTESKRMRLVQPEHIIITKVDLLIFLKDLQDFEQKYKLSCIQTELPLWDNSNPEPINNLTTHNDNDMLMIGHDVYTFGPLQAKIIKELYKAASTNNPWVLGKNLLMDSGARTQHLRDLFRSHPILSRIKYRSKGYYCLMIT